MLDAFMFAKGKYVASIVLALILGSILCLSLYSLYF